MAKVFQLIASSGQSVPTDAVAGQTLALTGGTVTLVNDGAYGYLWRLVGGYLENQALTGQGNYGEPSAPKTVAFRFRVSNRQAAFTRWAIYGSDPGTGVVIGNNSVGGASAGALRSGAMAGGSMVSGLSTIAKTYTADTVLTVVLRANFGTTDLMDLWYQTAGRVGTTADASLSTTFSFGSAVCDTLRLTAASGETLDILDFVVWDTLLTDAQCASAADDLRTFLASAPSASASMARQEPAKDTFHGSAGVPAPRTASMARQEPAKDAFSGSATAPAAVRSVTVSVVNNTNTAQAAVTIPHVVVMRLSDRTVILSLANQTTDGSGNLVISNASLVNGVAYIVAAWNADGTALMTAKAVAA